MKRSSFLIVAAAVGAVAGAGPARLLAAEQIVAVRTSGRAHRQWMIGQPGSCAGARRRNPILKQIFAQIH